MMQPLCHIVISLFTETALAHAQAVTHVPWRAKQLASDEEEDQWQLLQEGACSSGLVSVMSVEGAKDSKRGYISKLQVCCV